ncbi:hypothetical protein BRD09_03165 [Halobacteriales archaeon SW_10_68_16]|jgi:hypothetical protein|nr:MAG: hypothetical protein BRD09_03165 [Halobacteriales archaeon SW_10_68_16]
MADDSEVNVVRDRRRDYGEEIVRIRVLRVPESEKFPEGIEFPGVEVLLEQFIQELPDHVSP